MASLRLFNEEHDANELNLREPILLKPIIVGRFFKKRCFEVNRLTSSHLNEQTNLIEHIKSAKW